MLAVAMFAMALSCDNNDNEESVGEPVLSIEPSATSIEFSADGLNISSDGSIISPSIEVITNQKDWTVEVESDKTWLNAKKSSTGKTFIIRAEANTAAAPREETILTIKAGSATPLEITVTQKGIESKPPNPSDYYIINPYAEVNFATTLNLRGQLHVHTTASDGTQTSAKMIEDYVQRKFDIVAITNHDSNGTDSYFYPAEKEDITETEYRTVLGKTVLVIKGIEITNPAEDHFNNLFITEEFRSLPRQKGMMSDIGAQINGTDGIVILNHPWRTARVPVPFYSELLASFPKERLIGIEARNETDRKVWDGVLTALAPERNVFGFATDDAHYYVIDAYSRFGYYWTEILVSENTVSDVKESIRNGRSFLVENTTNANSADIYSRVFPSVSNIAVNQNDMSITVEATGYTKIEWISCGEIVGATKTIKPFELDLDKYLRFELTGDNGVLYSQPFLLVKD